MLRFLGAIARRAQYGWSHNLGLRLSVSLSLMLLLLMGLLSGTLIFQQHRALRQAAENHARAIARTFSAVGSAAVLDNLFRLQESMQLYMQTDSLLDIDIVDRDNMVVASKDPSRIGTVLQDPAWRDATGGRQETMAESTGADGRHTVLIVEPLYDRGDLMAWVRLVISLDKIEHEASVTFWQLLAVTLSIMMIGLYAIQVVIRKASSALHGVVEILQSAESARGKAAIVPVTTSVAPRGHFERLVAAAAAAATSLSEQSKAMQELAHSLEDKVVARTAELEEARAHAVRTMESLRESESRLRSLVEHAADAILVIDAQWAIESVNPAACALFGYGVTELCGRPIHSILLRPMPGWDAEHDDASGELCRRMGRTEVVGRRRDGTAFEAEMSMSTMTLEGRPHYTVIVRDVSERHHMEAMRRRTAERLQRLAEERAQLYHDLHDSLLQSLSAVSIGLETAKLLLTQAPERAPQQLEWTVAHLQQVIRDTRDFVARLEPRAAHQDNLLRAFRSLVQPSPTWPCPPFHIEVDPEVASRLSVEQEIHLLSIVEEAVSNTVRHAHARSGRIRLGSWEGSIRLEIGDDGTGFTPLDIERSGPGLSTMASHARALRGQLTVDSAPGGGTHILLLIPQAANGRFEGDTARENR